MNKESFEELKRFTFDEVGLKWVKPLRNMVFIRTDPPELMTEGGLYLPDSVSKMYSSPAHLRILKATVMSAGPQAKAQVGQRVCLQRLYFAYYKKLINGGYFGWVEDSQIIGSIAE